MTLTFHVLQNLAAIDPDKDVYFQFRGLWYRVRTEGPADFTVEAPDALTAKIEALGELLRRGA
jgi:hypothetical protein